MTRLVTFIVEESAENNGVVSISPDGKRATYSLLEAGESTGTVFLPDADFGAMTDEDVVSFVRGIFY